MTEALPTAYKELFDDAIKHDLGAQPTIEAVANYLGHSPAEFRKLYDVREYETRSLPETDEPAPA